MVRQTRRGKKTILEKITEIREELKQYQNLAEKEELASLEKIKKVEKEKLFQLQEILKPLLLKKNKLSIKCIWLKMLSSFWVIIFTAVSACIVPMIPTRGPITPKSSQRASVSLKE